VQSFSPGIKLGAPWARHRRGDGGSVPPRGGSAGDWWGLIERLDPDTLSQIERDPYGNIRLAELELSRLLKERVAASLGARGIATSIVAKAFF
jgi:hypothetical protein